MPCNWLPVHRKIKKLIKTNDEIALLGGSGSNKTWTLLHVICLRCLLLEGSRHLVVRKRFEHAKVTLWNSIKELMAMEWPGLYDQCETNRSGGSWVVTFPNGSEIHVGGLDDKERIEKWLGSEWATVYINECSEIQDENDVDLISSRLRQKIAGRHLLLIDENPPSKKHWSYRRYIEDSAGVEGRTYFKINPIDVKENLPASYIKRLENLPERLRQRFLHGEFTSDVEGALWSWEMIQATRNQLAGETGRLIIAVDPAVTSNKDSDETGIIVAAERGEGAVIMDDRSGRYTPNEWAGIVCDLYHQHRADAVVCEVNQGGDLLEAILKQKDPSMNVVKVRATRGKHTRAEPCAAIYEQGLIEHEGNLSELEDQMLSWVPGAGSSPDRVDALVWALTDLMIDRSSGIDLDFI